MKKKIALVTSIIFISIILTSCLSSEDLNNTKVISVSASGDVTLSPDIATFTVEVNETEKTTSEALNSANKKMAEVLRILYSHNIADKDIATTSLNLSPQYNWEDGKRILIGQSASQSINVKIRNIDDLGKIIDEIGKISNINLYSIRYDKEDKTASYEEARIKAVKNAIAKATTLANAANMELGEPISISEGTTPAYSTYNRLNTTKMMVAESASYDTQMPTGELLISTSVNIIFTLE